MLAKEAKIKTFRCDPVTWAFCGEKENVDRVQEVLGSWLDRMLRLEYGSTRSSDPLLSGSLVSSSGLSTVYAMHSERQ